MRGPGAQPRRGMGGAGGSSPPHLFFQIYFVWIERKTKFNIFPIFIFRVMVILVTSSSQFSVKFCDSSKNKNQRIFVLFFPLYSAYFAFYIKFPPLLRMVWGLHVVNQVTANLFTIYDSYKDFWIITLIILLGVYILGKSKHLIGPHNVCWTIVYYSVLAHRQLKMLILNKVLWQNINAE